MAWQSALAIYFLFWSFSIFVVLPFGVQTADEAGVERVPGQAESAPHHYDFGRVAFRTTIVATVAFALFYLNFVNGWLTVDMLDYTQWGRRSG